MTPDLEVRHEDFLPVWEPTMMTGSVVVHPETWIVDEHKLLVHGKNSKFV